MVDKLLIVDSMIIIDGHAYGFWKALLTSSYEIYVTSIVKEESFFYKDHLGRQTPIDLQAEVNKGSIKIIEATPDELARLQASSTDRCNNMIHAGEKEAIALLKTRKYDNYRYCTGDGAAVRVLSAHELGSLGISLEEVLINIGQSHKLPKSSYSKSTFHEYLSDGLVQQTLLVRGNYDKPRFKICLR